MTVKIKTPENQEELPIEILVEHITNLSNVGKQLLNSRLKQRVIVLLLQDMTGLGVSSITKILNALPCLENEYLKPKVK